MPQKFQYKGLKKQKKSYSGKKKAHTFKVQAIVHYKTQQILSLCTSRGAVHDFELFKRNLNQIPASAFILADKGANSNMRCDSFKSHMIINKLSKFL
ncbi:transposase [Acinetobacter johnsonii]|uniref:transposase n=2 Tax=Acinetobacter johnsonii TaxID=40214 RepID=UPI0039905680